MKLWYSTTSPFVRKVMAVLKYHKLDEQIELLRVTSAFDPNSPHNQDNPLGRIPALQLDNGEWLFGSNISILSDTVSVYFHKENNVGRCCKHIL